MKAIENRKILRVKTDGTSLETVEDAIAVESEVSVTLNRTSHLTLRCTPERLQDLVVGYLFSEGIIDEPNQLTRFQIIDDRGCEVDIVPDPNLLEKIEQICSHDQSNVKVDRSILSSLGKSYSSIVPLTQSSEGQFPLSAIQKAIDTLNRDAVIYRRTGGVHAACIASGMGEVVCLAEDVGRYNAVDKAIGGCLLQGCSFQDKILATTGRVAGVTILKAARVKIPVVASISAVLSSGMDLAEKAGVTTLGFVRSERMNIYTHAERVRISE